LAEAHTQNGTRRAIVHGNNSEAEEETRKARRRFYNYRAMRHERAFRRSCLQCNSAPAAEGLPIRPKLFHVEQFGLAAQCRRGSPLAIPRLPTPKQGICVALSSKGAQYSQGNHPISTPRSTPLLLGVAFAMDSLSNRRAQEFLPAWADDAPANADNPR